MDRMEFVENFFGGKKKKQKELLGSLGISQELQKETVGPDREEALIAEVNNNKFLEVLKSQDQKMFRTYLVTYSDTHRFHNLFLDIGEGVQIKTNVDSVDYSEKKTLLTKLYETGFRTDDSKGNDRWSVHILQDQSPTGKI